MAANLKQAWAHEDRERDIFILRELVSGGELSEEEDEAFTSMLEWVERHESRSLSRAQRSWVYGAAEKYQTRTGPPRPVPRGKEVPTPDVLRNLPKFPPGRRPT